MRPIAPEILEKINQPIQTRDNNSSFSNYIWIKRPTTELIDGRFIEKVTYLEEAENAKDFDIAICHPIEGHIDTTAFESYITGGSQPKLRVAEVQIESKVTKKNITSTSTQTKPEPIIESPNNNYNPLIINGVTGAYSGGKLRVSWRQEYYASSNSSKIRITAVELSVNNGGYYGNTSYYPGGETYNGVTSGGKIKINNKVVGEFSYRDAYSAVVQTPTGYYPIVTKDSGYSSNYTAVSDLISHKADGSLTFTITIERLCFANTGSNISAFCFQINQSITIGRPSQNVVVQNDDGEWPIVEYTIHNDPINYSGVPVSCAVAFDGTMPNNSIGHVEFVTDEYPWVFCAYNDGKLLAKELNSNKNPVTLENSGCTDVSAIRAMWNEYGNVDLGLVCFFIKSGKIYYRQYINGVWMDSIAVSKLPSGKTWTEITAFRTWDYRVGFHAKNSNNEVYEVFTKFMGISRQNNEHIDISITAEGNVIRTSDINPPRIIEAAPKYKQVDEPDYPDEPDEPDEPSTNPPELITVRVEYKQDIEPDEPVEPDEPDEPSVPGTNPPEIIEAWTE